MKKHQLCLQCNLHIILYCLERRSCFYTCQLARTAIWYIEQIIGQFWITWKHTCGAFWGSLYLGSDQRIHEASLTVARLSCNFVFGGYTSIDLVLEHLLTSASVITRSVLFFPRDHDVDMWQTRLSSGHILLSRDGCSLNLQEYLDNITTPLNATCPVWNLVL